MELTNFMKKVWVERDMGMTSNAGPVQSLSRATVVLESVGRGGDGGATFTEIVDASGLPKSTVHRLAMSLVELGWLEFEAAGERYFLGRPLLRLGAVAANRHGLAGAAGPHIDRLSEQYEDTVYLSARRGDRIECLLRVRGRHELSAVTLGVGQVRDLGTCAGSLAVLSCLDAVEREASMNRLEAAYSHQGIDRSELEQMVEEARRDGYAGTPTTIVRGVDGVGVPIFAGEAVIGAISVDAPTHRLEGERRMTITESLREAARATEVDLALA